MKKVDMPKIWRLFTLMIALILWLLINYVFKIPSWTIIPIFTLYLIINAIVFNSYLTALIGNYYYFTGKTEKALKTYENAVRKNTKNVLAIYNYAVEILKQGNGKYALELLNKADSINTKIIMEKNIILAKGSCYWIINEIDKAIETLEELKNKYSYVNAHVLTTLGYLYFLKKDYNKALDYSNEALEDTKEHAPAWDNIGQIYFIQKDYEKAEQTFKKALTYNENMVDSLYYLGIIYENQNKLDKAYEYFSKAFKCNISSLNTVTKSQIEEKYNKYKNI